MEKHVTPTYWPENLAFAWSILFPVSHLGTYKGKKCDKNYSIMNLPRIAYSIGSYCSNPPPNFENIRNITKRTLYTIDILYAVLEKALAFSLNCSTPLAPQWCVAPVFTNHYIESSLVTMVKSGRPWDFLKKKSLDTQTTLKPINELPRCLRIQTSSNGHALHYEGTVEIATLDLASYWGFPNKPTVVTCNQVFRRTSPKMHLTKHDCLNIL